MEQEILNTFLGVIHIPAWLEASLAVCFIIFLMIMGHRKTKAQIEANQALIEACKSLSISARDASINTRNLQSAIQNRLDSATEINQITADIFIQGAIDSVFYQVQNFCVEMGKNAPDNILNSFLAECYLDFASKLSRISVANGKRLGDFAQVARWHFEERLRDHIRHGQENSASAYIKRALEMEWSRWK